jgi:hypothetical protein
LLFAVQVLLPLLGTQTPAWHVEPDWHATSTYPVPLGAHTWLVLGSLHRVLSGAQTIAAQLPAWHVWLFAQADGV